LRGAFNTAIPEAEGQRDLAVVAARDGETERADARQGCFKNATAPALVEAQGARALGLGGVEVRYIHSPCGFGFSQQVHSRPNGFRPNVAGNAPMGGLRY
jgi:hypothetical protein